MNEIKSDHSDGSNLDGAPEDKQQRRNATADGNIFKNDKKAKNKDYDKKEYCQAMKKYNQSIAFAKNNTESLSIGYANRSVAHFEQNYFYECLYDIKLTEISKGYPSEQMEELVTRKKKCEMAILENNLTQLTLDKLHCHTKLSHGKHPQLPTMMANCLERIESQEDGLSIKTNTDLKAGNIIAINKPLAAVLLPKYHYAFCSNCLKETYSLIPCPSCTSVMFCSRKCLKTAYIAFHKYECNIIDYEQFPESTEKPLLTVRMILQAISLFKGDIDQLMNFENSEKSSDPNLINMYFRSIDDDTTSNYDFDDNYDDDEDYEDSDGSRISEITEKNYYQFYVDEKSDAALTKLISESGELNRIRNQLFKILEGYITTDEHRLFIRDLILRFYKIAKIYNEYLIITRFIVSEDKVNDSGFDVHRYGIGIYASYRLIQHSCVPNIRAIYNGSTKNLLVLRPIKSGQQLFEAYSRFSVYTIYEKELRQKILKENVYFDCKCEACLQNVELKSYTALKRLPKIVYNENLEGFDEKLAEICKYLNTYSEPNNESQNAELHAAENYLIAYMTHLLTHRLVNRYKNAIKFTNDNGLGSPKK